MRKQKIQSYLNKLANIVSPTIDNEARARQDGEESFS